MKSLPLFALLIALGGPFALGAEPLTLNVWPGKPPGETKELSLEADQTKPQEQPDSPRIALVDMLRRSTD